MNAEWLSAALQGGSMTSDLPPVVYTPDNEPYLGRELLFHLDQIIASAMEQNALLESSSEDGELTSIQLMAAQQIGQFLNLLCSIRELVRQGYLFGAHVLVRPLIERQVVLLYLHLFPEKIQSWDNGWHQGDAPGLAKMIDEIQKKWNKDEPVKGRDMLKQMNSLLHAKLDSIFWGLVHVGDDKFIHAPSKILNRPELCDELCADVIPCVATVQAMMSAYFPSKTSDGQ